MDLTPLKKAYIQFSTNNLGENADEDILRRVKIINIGGGAILLAGIFWVLADILILERAGAALVEGFAVLLGIILLYWQRKVKNLAITTNLVLALLSFALLSLQAMYGIEKSNAFWLYLIPPFAFFLCGLKSGVIWSIVSLLSVQAFFVIRRVFFAIPGPDLEYMLDFVTSYLIVTFLSFHFEKVRAQASKALNLKNEQMQRFVYTVSHDLRSPLTSLRGYLSFVREEIDNKDTRQRDCDLQKIDEVARGMGEMIDDLLSLSRVGRDQVPPEKADIGEVVKKIVDENESQIRVNKIKIEITGEFPKLLLVRRKIEEIFRNLISNAIKYKDEQKKSWIRIGVEEDADEYRFFVKDNGIGIEPAHQARIFEPFLHPVQVGKGTGIGLSIVGGFVKDLGGKVWLESVLGQGSTFWFSLPKVEYHEK